MDLDANLIKEKIEEYRKDKNCAQSTLMGICEVAGLDIEDLPALAAGFGGGPEAEEESALLPMKTVKDLLRILYRLLNPKPTTPMQKYRLSHK